MKKIPANELNLAAHMVLSFANGSGETSLFDLSCMTGVGEERLTSWAEENGYLDSERDSVSLAVLPKVWEEFAGESRVCLALNLALAEIIKLAPSGHVADWVEKCAVELQGLRMTEEQQEAMNTYLLSLKRSSCEMPSHAPAA